YRSQRRGVSPPVRAAPPAGSRRAARLPRSTYPDSDLAGARRPPGAAGGAVSFVPRAPSGSVPPIPHIVWREGGGERSGQVVAQGRFLLEAGRVPPGLWSAAIHRRFVSLVLGRGVVREVAPKGEKEERKRR